ncbi:MAG TPA: hypothetical protein VK762_01875 [Polyangiaceae bacterium]|nr:hypothetical protein [Polyangiaceae bacterium]
MRSPGAHAFPRDIDVRQWQARDRVAPVGGADAIVNLVGNPIFAEAWTAARKEELTETRRIATRSLVDGLRKAGGEGRTFVSSSAIEYAGDTGDALVDETTALVQGIPGRARAPVGERGRTGGGDGAELHAVLPPPSDEQSPFPSAA